MQVAIGLLILFRMSSLLANELNRPANYQELGHYSSDRGVKVQGAKVSYVNVEALKRDFPQLKELTIEQIREWVLENFAYVSEGQTLLNDIRNETIPVQEGKSVSFARPPTYGRAGVLEGKIGNNTIGLVDIKGLGLTQDTAKKQKDYFNENRGKSSAIAALRDGDHSDGLMSHGEAIAELTRQAATQKLMEAHNKNAGTFYQTVETYFIIALPFKKIFGDGHLDSVALYGRQAHLRERGSDSSIFPADLIRPGGRYTGVQLTTSKSLVDFGDLTVSDPRLAATYGPFDPSIKYFQPTNSKPIRYGYETAKKFESGDPEAVYQHLEKMTAPLSFVCLGLPSATQVK